MRAIRAVGSRARRKGRGLLLPSLLALLLGGCSASPMNVVADFWQALADGDLEAAADLSSQQDVARLARLFERHPIAGIEVGAVRIQESVAKVETRLQRNAGPIVFDTHLRDAGEGWQVDVDATIGAVRQAVLESSVAELREAFEESADVLSDAAQQGLEEAAKAIREALGELEAETVPPAEP